MTTDPDKDFLRSEDAYDLLWATATTKLWGILGDPFIRSIFDLVVTIGNNKSYAYSGHKISLAKTVVKFVQNM